jgi:chromosome segregation ATPase
MTPLVASLGAIATVLAAALALLGIRTTVKGSKDERKIQTESVTAASVLSTMNELLERSEANNEKLSIELNRVRDALTKFSKELFDSQRQRQDESLKHAQERNQLKTKLQEILTSNENLERKFDGLIGVIEAHPPQHEAVITYINEHRLKGASNG